MITDILLDFLFQMLFILTAPLRLFPNVVLPTFMTDNNSNFFNILNNLNNFIELRVLFSCVAILLIFESTILTLKLVFWVRKLI